MPRPRAKSNRALLLIMAHMNSRDGKNLARHYGTIMDVQLEGHDWGTSVGPPAHAFVTITDLDKDGARHLMSRWGVMREVAGHNWDSTTDTGQLRFYGAKVNQYGDGKLEVEDISTFLEAWNVTLASTGDNEILVNADISTMGDSAGYLGLDLNRHRWVESAVYQGYQQPTHAYRVDLVDTATLEQYEKIKAHLAERGAIIPSGSEDPGNRAFTYTVQMSDIRNWLQSELDIRNEGGGKYAKWKLPMEQMDKLVAGTLPGQTEAFYYENDASSLQAILEDLEPI